MVRCCVCGVALKMSPVVNSTIPLRPLLADLSLSRHEPKDQLNVRYGE